MSKLYFRYGAMSSGKSLDLIKVYFNYRERGMDVLVMKPFIDTKGENRVTSRNGSDIVCDFLIKSDDNVFDIVSDVISKRDIRCVLIDEVQFMEKKHIDEISDIVDILDIPCICYGLRADFRGRLFTGSERLFEIADSIEELKTICDCGSKAIWNVRFVNGEVTFMGDQVAIDGEDDISYKSMCRRCVKKLKRRKE